MNIKTIFNELSNDIIEEILIRDSFINYISDKLKIIKESQKYRIKEPDINSYLE